MASTSVRVLESITGYGSPLTRVELTGSPNWPQVVPRSRCGSGRSRVMAMRDSPSCSKCPLAEGRPGPQELSVLSQTVAHTDGTAQTRTMTARVTEHDRLRGRWCSAPGSHAQSAAQRLRRRAPVLLTIEGSARHPVLDGDPCPAADHTGLRHLGLCLDGFDRSRGCRPEDGSGRYSQRTL